MFRPGSILKITVKNFVTYKYVELHPGAKLNMIIGPNGTGKSSIVAAIILGLGGSPRVIGRGTKISEYVMHNCEEAEIQIKLKGAGDTTFTITRQFNKYDKTVWLIDNQQKTAKDVLEYVNKYNIQVNNLCQFLPQDKVQDFAKMSKQELLKQTQVALCRQDLVDMQHDLIEAGSSQKSLSQKMKVTESNLEECKNANDKLESKVKNLDKRKQLEGDLRDIGRKIAWVKYYTVKEELTELGEDKDSAKSALSKHEKTAQPMIKAMDNLKKNVDVIKQKITNSNQSIKTEENKLQRLRDNQRSLTNSIDEVIIEKTNNLREIEERQFEIDSCKMKIQQLTNEKVEINATNNAGSLDDKINEMEGDIRKFSATIDNIQDGIADQSSQQREKQYEMRGISNEMERLENVRNQRLQWLQGNNRDAYQAALWLKDNKQMFQGEVYGPMMLELNVVDSKYAVYLENRIGYQDRIAFTCTIKSDMNLLIKQLREQRGLIINVVHSGNDGRSLASYQPRVPIEQLRRYGLYAYMHTLVTGPDPIMRYLCNTYHLHNTPIGDARTNDYFQEIGNHVRDFYSDKSVFAKSGSRYNSQYSSISQRGIAPSNGSLSISVDTNRLQHIRGRHQELESDFAQFDERIASLNVKITDLKRLTDIVRVKLQASKTVRTQVQGIDNKLLYLQQKCQRLEVDSRSRESVENSAKNKIMAILQKVVALQPNLVESLQQYSSHIQKQVLANVELTNTRRHLVYLDNKHTDIQEIIETARRLYDQITRRYNDFSERVRGLLQEAKRTTEGITPEQDSFDRFRLVYDRLSNDTDELEAESETIAGRLSCINGASETECHQYEETARRIQQLTDDLEKMTSGGAQLEATVTRLRQGWLDPLRQFVGEISERFGVALGRMGCVGEVDVYTGNNETDYENYGISIKVTYRNGEPLQELNTVTQSGGERAVATAVYMLSLQELTPVPFRCVDEINQGMDANNERRVFQLLLECTTPREAGDDTAQYFLITPKLITGMKFNEYTTVHIVHNGPFALPQLDFNKANFLGKCVH